MIPLTRFIDELAVTEDGEKLFLEPHQRAILNEAFKVDSDERFIYRTIIYSAPKKSGKTAINALTCLWFAHCVDPPNEIVISASDLDQSISRVFSASTGFIERNPLLKEVAEIQKLLIKFTNGTTIKAIPNDYQGESGGNQGLASFDELWGFMSERSRRLYEELTPVPTRKNSIRFVSTYAGWQDESLLLQSLYERIFDKQGNIKPGVKRPLGDDFPCYAIGDLFCYWDTETRMPWQTPEYYKSQRADLRTNTYLRLHENRWVSNESSLFDMADWDACIDDDHRPPLPNKAIRLYCGADASVKKDRSAVVSVYRNGNLVCLGPFRIWQPSSKEPMDFEATMESYVKELSTGFRIEGVFYDPYQFHRSAMTLTNQGIPMVEFPQTVSNMTECGQCLYDLVKHKNLKLYEDTEMRKEASFAIGKETPRGMRIVKEKSSHKIDAIVALAMAVQGISTEDQAQPGLFFIGGKEPPSTLRKEQPERVQNMSRIERWFLDED